MSWRRNSATICALWAASGVMAESLQAQRAALLDALQRTHRLDATQMAGVRAIFEGSSVLGQGNPEVSRHPITSGQCREQARSTGLRYDDPAFEAICGDRYMVPLYDPLKEGPQDARVCIDRFEFPNIPCEYPVVWVRAREAAGLCAAVGKRLCDAHEWEGGCAGRLLPADYDFARAAGLPAAEAVKTLRALHNGRWSGERRLAYGDAGRQVSCATGSSKSSGCDGGDWQHCGSNTYPAGMFPECSNALGAMDLHGNAAEHMNLPTRATEMASAGSETLGHTEMKGSWFVWDGVPAHPDWCRWRAPYWHGSAVLSEDSHRNYHLGFRCCKSLP